VTGINGDNHFVTADRARALAAGRVTVLLLVAAVMRSFCDLNGLRAGSEGRGVYTGSSTRFTTGGGGGGGGVGIDGKDHRIVRPVLLLHRLRFALFGQIDHQA
jgi:hypothetical protein